MNILKEWHSAECTCSYCGNAYDKPLHFGLNIPKLWWKWNSYYVLRLSDRRYYRFLLFSFLRRFQS